VAPEPPWSVAARALEAESTREEAQALVTITLVSGRGSPANDPPRAPRDAAVGRDTSTAAAGRDRSAPIRRLSTPPHHEGTTVPCVGGEGVPRGWVHKRAAVAAGNAGGA
jgi:hypothetical protein